MNPFLEALFQSIAGPPKLQQKLEPAKDQAGLDALINKVFQEALLLPENQVAEGGGWLKAPSPDFISQADPRQQGKIQQPQLFGAYIPGTEKSQLRVMDKAGMQPPVSVLTDEDYARLIQQMFSTAVLR